MSDIRIIAGSDPITPLSRGSLTPRLGSKASLRCRRKETKRQLAPTMDPRMWHKVAAISGSPFVLTCLLCFWIDLRFRLDQVLLLSVWGLTALMVSSQITHLSRRFALQFLCSIFFESIKNFLGLSRDLCYCCYWCFCSSVVLVERSNWKVWRTASLYHLVHTAALVGAPITKHPNIVIWRASNCRYCRVLGNWLWFVRCYMVAYLEDRKISFIAPYGGFAFLAAWASLLF
ncbi:hypothetical protein BHM03_00012289 [Ensete ventricosum]|nr:hypothetical protein BHM03_00012289 [Ensete ventricosum]